MCCGAQKAYRVTPSVCDVGLRSLCDFNNSIDYLSATSSSSTCLLGLKSYCGACFVQRWITLKTYIAKHARKRTMNRVATAVSVTFIEDVGSYWIGRAQKMRRIVGSKWEISQQHVDLLNNIIQWEES